MLFGEFRAKEGINTKKGKIYATILIVLLIVACIIVYNNDTKNRKFLKQAAMAENYLVAESYEKAVEAYRKALSMKKGDDQQLVIGLSKAYVGLNQYDRALELLRACYAKTTGDEIIKQIEGVISKKTDYEYLQSISRAEVYFSNKEYNKAISIFEDAKRIKGKEAISYQRIAEAYVALCKYDLAKDEILEGLEITQDDCLEDMLKKINLYILEEQYNNLLAFAKEYICYENYNEGIKQYKKAIELLPLKADAYLELAKIYIEQEDYAKAVRLLHSAEEHIHNDELITLLVQATEYNNMEIERISSLKKLNMTEEEAEMRYH